ncbi:MAG TPA: sigma-E processing peptidase SpoIIGA [Methylomusa anaerophila]|uniref:Sporulation factor SpoIIGA n=1 Tax=Methylomusa anaerophila TaxID=1930071 RepID=A0A348AQA5_9FIRM|nr:sigma-E processing peptidase SpoIIGA [Methylomusa anaerophila]BBB93253.1 sporulation factor SpoIIGA [Methylomusa anaerophila]HML86915.1 sigma-E processing peptidase SpoIIGA [Methylomusa anaerophila]
MYVYADVVITINFVMNSIILLLTAYGAGISFRWQRIFFAAMVSSIYSLGSIWKEVLFFYTAPAKLVASLVIIIIAFGKKPVKVLCVLWCAFFLVSFILGGAVIGWLYFLQTSALSVLSESKSIVTEFGSLSWQHLAVGGSMGIGLITLLVKQLLARIYRKQTLYQVTVNYNGMETNINGLVDTGNSLFSVSGHNPVVLASYQSILGILSHSVASFLQNHDPDTWISEIYTCEDEAWLSRIEPVPYVSVGKCSMLLGFRPDKISIATENGIISTSKVVIGIYAGTFSKDIECDALLHPALINRMNSEKGEDICA